MALTEAEELELLELENEAANNQSQPTEPVGFGQRLEQGIVSLGQSLEPVARGIGHLSDVGEVIQGALQPESIPQILANRQYNQGLGALEQGVSEYAGEKGITGIPSALLGTAAGIVANPLTYANMGGGISGRIAEPIAPMARREAVSAAESIGMPLRRGEITGGRRSLGLSNLMEKTDLGAGPEQRFTARQFEALGTEKQRLQGAMGTSEDAYAAGLRARAQVPLRQEVMRLKRDQLFKNIPDEVSIPLNEYARAGDIIIQQESKVRPLARNSDVLKFAEDAQKPYISEGKGVTGGPEYTGIEEGGIRASVSPETPFAPKSNYYDVKGVRETLTGKITEAHNAGNFKAERHFIDLKNALDKDIEAFASAPETPLDSLVAKEFKSRYRQANAFSGAYKGLFKSDEANRLLDTPPEKIIQTTFIPNNETGIKRFRALVGEDGFGAVKRKFTNDLLESGNLLKEMDRLKGSLKAIYTNDEINQLRRYGLAQSVPKSVQGVQGTQGSARTNVQRSQYGGLGAGLYGLFKGNIPVAAAGIGQYLAPAAISRLNLATARGIPYSVGAGGLSAMKYAASTARPVGTSRDIISQFVDRMINQENR